jgi:hypothetical protein
LGRVHEAARLLRGLALTQNGVIVYSLLNRDKRRLILLLKYNGNKTVCDNAGFNKI